MRENSRVPESRATTRGLAGSNSKECEDEKLLEFVVREKKMHNEGFQTLQSSIVINFNSDKDVINTLFPTLGVIILNRLYNLCCYGAHFH